MKNSNNIKKFFLCFFGLVVSLVIFSCQGDELDEISYDIVNDQLSLKVNEKEVTLDEQLIERELGFTWSTGTNNGTGAAIRYTLEIDLAGSDFSDPLLSPVEGEKITYTWSIDHGTLNNILLERGLDPEKTYDLEARVTAQVADATVDKQTAAATFAVTTFKPVSDQLFIVGDATPNGWDIGKAIELAASTMHRGVFIYEGKLVPGNFKFAVSRDGCFCQDFYTRDPNDASKIVYNLGGSGEDIQWTVTEEDSYRITVDLLNKTLLMEPMEDRPFSELWILGDATESGWDINNPAPLAESPENPFIFTYEGNFKPGGFKIFAGPLGDFCGEWYRPSKDNQALINGPIDQRAGCDQDYKWLVTDQTQGRYRITLNTQTNSIEFEKVNLYIVGDGSPSGWDIASPLMMSYEDGFFVFNGELGADNPTGEFKFAKETGDWCAGEWVNSAVNGQSVSNTEFIITQGCEGPDNKWKLKEGEAGTYEIRINLDSEMMTITKL